MICAHTVRRLRPGTFDQFAEAFMPAVHALPSGWTSFHMLRSLRNENEVVTFGLFDGTIEEMERGQDVGDYQSQQDAIRQYVDEVLFNGVYEVARSWTPAA
jgi:hypothetical protein